MTTSQMQPVCSTNNADYFIKANPRGTWSAYRHPTAQPIRQIGGHYFSEAEAREAAANRADRDI